MPFKDIKSGLAGPVHFCAAFKAANHSRFSGTLCARDLDHCQNTFETAPGDNPEALAAYAKFLRHETLVETAPTGFSAEALQDKMHRIQRELPDWVQKSGQQAQVMPLTQKLNALMKDRKWQEVDKVADELLSLMSHGAK